MQKDETFNSRSGCMHAMPLKCSATKLSNLDLKIKPKQLIGPLPMVPELLANTLFSSQLPNGP